jgi:hypothetical protein
MEKRDTTEMGTHIVSLKECWLTSGR